MNPLFRTLLFALLLLTSALTTVAQHRPLLGGGRSGSSVSRHSIVAEYKKAYARPKARHTLFGKRKMASYFYARVHRPSRS